MVQQYIKDSISARISLPESADMELSVLEIAILKPFLEGMTEVLNVISFSLTSP